MPSHDEPPPPSADHVPLALLAAEANAAMEAYEQAITPPTAAEWAEYLAHEETRLEERCADLIASLTPALPTPATAHTSRGRGASRRSRTGGSAARSARKC